MQPIRLLLLITFCAGMIVIAQPGPPSAPAKMHAPAKQKQAIATAAQVNGTWRYGKNEFKIWALGDRKLRVEFSGIYEYRSPAGPTANTGEGSGIANIEGDTAIFKPEVSEAECRITMKFVGAKLIVDQQGICGFGFNVSSGGTYHKISSRKPKFEQE